MTTINKPLLSLCSIVCCLALSACSSTQDSYSDSNSRLNNGYYANQFTKTAFEEQSANTEKKPPASDHELMITLLNRPMTADQAMMERFERERAQYAHSFSIQRVAIKGERSSDKTQERAQHAYAHLINKDNNSIEITAMPK